MSTFFNSWQLWEKMCFVLGVAIVGVILLGCCKVVYNHWRLRKYTKLAAVKEQHRQAIQQRPSVRARKGREIPFGVRAIESGIEVDGVWISRSNTPNASTSGSPAPSIMLEPSSANHVKAPDRVSTAPTPQGPDVPQPVHGLAVHGRGRNSTSSYIPAFQDQASNHERLPRSSTASDHVPRARPTYQPKRSSGLRFSNSQDNSGALAALEGRRMAPTPEIPESQDYIDARRPRRNSSSGSGSYSGDEHYAPHRPTITRDSSDILFDPTYLPSGVPRTSDTNQPEYFTNHRRSHAAEEGQLRPRMQSSNTRGSINYETPFDQRFLSKVHDSSNGHSDPFATPIGTPMGTPRSDYMEQPPSFADFVNSSPQPNSRIETSDEAESSPPNSYITGNALQQGDGNRQHRHSQGIRKVNSGFEILPAGSLSQTQGRIVEWNEKPGIESGKQSTREADVAGNKRHSRKLQRKRADSKESRFKEEV